MKAIFESTNLESTTVNWFGAMPSHWTLLPNRAIFSEMKEVGYPDEQLLSVTIAQGVVWQEHIFEDESRKDVSRLDKSNYKFVQPGDIVYNKMRAWQGAIGISQHQGIVSSAYIVQRPRALAFSVYFGYLYRTPMFAKEAEKWSYGIASDMWSLRPEHFKMIYSCVPPFEEQKEIVRYLDHADQMLRGGGSQKLELAELMEEYKRAVIQQAVTRGLDPDVPLKPSGVEWFGDIPEHWEVRRLKTVADMRVSNVDKHINDDEIPVRLCNYVDVYKNDLIDGTIDFMPASATEDEISRFHLRIGDVLITKDSETWDDIGVPALVVETAPDLVSGYHLALLRPDTTQLLGSYLFRALQSRAVAYQFHVEARGVTRYGLSHSGILSAAIPLPPVEEQAAIVAHLDKLTSDIDAAIAHTRREIELLEEYRTRLIADVVTGKLDVREAAANLPDVNPDDIKPLAEGSEADN